MAGAFKVTGAAVALPTVGGGLRYLYRSPVALPREGFTDAGLEHAVAVGLVELVEVEEESAKPVEKMTAAELKTYAEEHGIDLGAAKNKGEILEAITAHEAGSGEQPAGAQQQD